MVGGIVIEVADHPTENILYVNVVDRNNRDKCALYVLKNEQSDQIEIGDALWWHGSIAYWTPKNNRIDDEAAKTIAFKCGIDFDIPLKRIGYSGVASPYSEREWFKKSVK